jgi:predicted unusual protein kinase regulating ubiquinone biosynthesis (AarF/ABC1/UbiB family)
LKGIEMPKKIHPKIRRQKAAELIEKAKLEEQKRYAEIGQLYVSTFLNGKAKTNGNFEEFKQKAEKILNNSTKKQPSPQNLQATAKTMYQEAEEEEAERQRQIGQNLLQILDKRPPGPANSVVSEIEKMASQIWME